MIKTKNSRSRLCRLEELEEFVQDHYDTGPAEPITAPEMLEYYQRCAKTRLFDREPDFLATLAEFERIMRAIPPERHVPTDDFEPDKPERRRLQIWNIRHGIMELRPIYEKLNAMSNRAFQGLEGVSEAEFEQRKAWFKQNIDDLPMHYMIAEDGKTEPRKNTIETALYNGPSSDHALNAMITLREWEKGNYDKSTTYGEWKRKRQEKLAQW